MKKLLSLAVLCASVVVAPLVANATPTPTLTTSSPFSLFNVSINGASSLYPYTSITSIDFSSGTTTSNGTGTPFIPAGTTISSSLPGLYPNGPDGGTTGTPGSPFTITFSGYGTFTATSDPVVVANTSSGSSSSGLEIYLLGVFTPSGAFSAYGANNASLDISFTQTGGSVSGSGTFATPAIPLNQTPEPSSLILLGTGLIGGVTAVRRRFKA